jgi:PEP-CTERM motif
MLKLPRLLPLVAVACLLALPSVALADSFTVYVGYADNLRASGFFPTPWLGAADVVSQTPSGQSLDTGAIRIDNTGASPITITNFTVTLNGGANVFSIWSSLTINPGQNGIFTQTASYNFDSSDFGIFGGLPPASLAPTIPGNNEIGGCSSTASILAASGDAALCASHAPVISFMENGNLVTMTDTGQIVNTGGWDFVNNTAFGEDGNESINWNVIGSGANRGGTGVPEPSSLLLLCSGLIGFGGFARRKLLR